MSTPQDQTSQLISQMGSFQPNIPSYTPPDTSGIDTQIHVDRAHAQSAEDQLEGLDESKAQLAESTAGDLQQYQAQMDQLLQQYPAQQVFQATAMHSAPIVGILAALGGRAAGISGQGMLGAMNGMMEGINQGAQERYQEQLSKWKQELDTLKQRHELQMEIYQSMLTAYSGRADAAQKARDFALAATRDDMATRESQVKDSIDIFKARTTALADADKITMGLDRILAQLQIGQTKANPPVNESEVDAIGTYKLPPRTGRTGDAIMSAVAAKYPNYDATKYATKQATLQSFAHGNDGKTLDSLNTTVAHLQQLRGLIAALGSGDSQHINAAKLQVQEWLGYDAPTNYEAVRDLAAGEVNKIVTGGPGAQEDRAKAAGIFSRAKSPEQIGGAIDEVSGLMAGRLAPIKQRFMTYTKLSEEDWNSQLLPETRDFLGAHHGQTAPSSSSSSSSASSASGPQPGDVQRNGKTYRKVNGKWFEVTGG